MIGAPTYSRGRKLARWIALVITATTGLAVARSVRADDSGAPWSFTPFDPCPHCSLFVGVGTTFRYYAWTDGVVVPFTLELDDSRWELGAFRFATAQYLKEPGVLPPSTPAANPYWAFSLMRRWQVLHRGRSRLYLGFGANYRTETDYIESTNWNFAFLVGVRFDLASHGPELELAARHWSNAWFGTTNRGENLVTISVSF